VKILHLAAGNRWTGAAAPAFAEVESLREAGIDAHFAYVGGYLLQTKLARVDFAHPIIEKSQNLLAFNRTLQALTRLIDLHGFDYLHAHLTYDHWLARFAARSHGIKLARTFHSRRVLRSEPFTHSLIRATDVLFVINESFCLARPVRKRHATFTPPPVDLRQFRPEGPNARAAHNISPGDKVVTVIGKMSKGRGFEDALRTFALLRKRITNAKMLIIGHGEHRSVLDSLARELAIEQDLTWAGYREVDLAEHYRASNILLFTARGSDEGHRAVLEAMACGVPPVVFPIEGIRALVGALAPQLIAAEATPEALAARAEAVLANDQLPRLVAAHAEAFGYERAATRLIEAYRARM
jgi:glycosyltransferase involved in cell wall biosynthesis